VVVEVSEPATTVVAPSTEAGGSSEVAGRVVEVARTVVAVVTWEVAGASVDGVVLVVSPTSELHGSSSAAAPARSEGHSLPLQLGSSTWVL
jgi:hypothetical protein